MRSLFWWLLFVLTPSAQALELAPLPQQAQAAVMSSELLSHYHYKAMPLDDALSEKIFAQYLKALDPDKYFFDQSDIDQFSSLRLTLDDVIREQNLSPAFALFNRYRERVVERFTAARALLKEGFDFSQNDNLELSRGKATWPKNAEESRELWRKRVKNDWLRLKLAGRDDQAIIDTLSKRYEASIRRIGRLKSEDAFQTFMNAYTMAIDPHTNYLGPRATENFDISMRLSLVGIGATLQEKDEYTTIRELITGSPAAKSGKLKVGDRIVGVGQGENGTLIDIVGWRLDDTVRLIRGEADTVVRLDVLANDGVVDQHKLVSLVRKKITLDEQAAKKTVIPVSIGGVTRQIGIITLPSFYLDFEARQKGDPNFKSATRDIDRLLQELKKQNVDSVLIDLRDNGGGSLAEAISLTGLFIDQGPVVQQRDANGKITVESDTQAGVAWNGKLGVLINRHSASASEIFAAAIQDYGRGLIIGEPSFGKGTVQSMINMDRISRNEKSEYGELKLTIAQFFRISGDTTQLRGVTPDIAFPSESDGEDQRESGFDNALPWIQIKAADYTQVGNLNDELPILRSQHEYRLKHDKDLQYLQEDFAEIDRLRKKNSLSLNEAERRQERNAQEARLSSRDARKVSLTSKTGRVEPGNSLRDDGLLANERPLDKELAASKKRKNAKDPVLIEAAYILGDECGLQTGAAVAATNPVKTDKNVETKAQN